jgi:endoglucanase
VAINRKLAAILASALLATGAAQAAPPPGSPVAINGKLRVCGTKLCNKHGKPIQLRGMSTHGLQWYAHCLNTRAIDALAKDWKADVIRLSLYVQEGGYETAPAKFTRLMNTLVEKVTARGLYVIIDWHILTPGDPFHNLAHAKTFFKNVATRHKSKINVLYEVANEPNGVTWNHIKNYHNKIIPVIRARDPDAVILLGTRDWSSLGVSNGFDETEIINNPVNARNVMYTFHFYAASHHDAHYNALNRASQSLPIFVTEFGTQQYTGDGPNDFVYAQKYITLMKQRKISWTNWNFSDNELSGAVLKVLVPRTCRPKGNFTGPARLKEAGKWIRARIRTPDNFPR